MRLLVQLLLSDGHIRDQTSLTCSPPPPPHFCYLFFSFGCVETRCRTARSAAQRAHPHRRVLALRHKSKDPNGGGRRKSRSDPRERSTSGGARHEEGSERDVSELWRFGEGGVSAPLCSRVGVVTRGVIAWKRATDARTGNRVKDKLEKGIDSREASPPHRGLWVRSSPNACRLELELELEQELIPLLRCDVVT